MKLRKKLFFLGGGGVGSGGGGEGVRVDVNGEVKFFENSKKTFFFFGGGGVGSGLESGWGVSVDVNGGFGENSKKKK